MSFQQVNLWTNFSNGTSGKLTTPQTISTNKLENSPPTDTVCFKGAISSNETYKGYSCEEGEKLRNNLAYSTPHLIKGNYDIIGDDVQLSVKNDIKGNQIIQGNAFNLPVNLKIDKPLLNFKRCKMIGNIGDKTLDIKCQTNDLSKKLLLSGNIDELDDKSKALALMLLDDIRITDKKTEELIIASM